MTSRSRACRLFERFEQIYGPRWKGGDIEQWTLGLEGLTNAEIARGIDHARKESEWPPNIAEFRKLARPPIDQPLTEIHVAGQRKPIDKQGAEKAISRIREILD